MFVLKLRIHNKNVINNLTSKYNVSVYGYPLSSFEKNDKFYVNITGNIEGEEKNRSKFLEDLQKEHLIKKVENKKNYILICIEQPRLIKFFYSPDIIFFKPIHFSSKHYQEYYLGSWKKSMLQKVLNYKLEGERFEVIKFREEHVGKSKTPKISINLTAKQEKAFITAFESGYYNFPRQADLRELSQKMGIGFSTYQTHLRKAEKSMMEFLYRYFVSTLNDRSAIKKDKEKLLKSK